MKSDKYYIFCICINHYNTSQQFNQIMITVGVIIKDKKFVIVTEPKTNHFDLTKDVNNSLKHESDFIIKHNEFLEEQTTKTRLVDYFHVNNKSMETIFVNTENTKTNELRKFILN